jgi:hypothetical protein
LTLFEKAWTLAGGNPKISSVSLFQSAMVLFTKENIELHQPNNGFELSENLGSRRQFEG